MSDNISSIAAQFRFITLNTEETSSSSSSAQQHDAELVTHEVRKKREAEIAVIRSFPRGDAIFGSLSSEFKGLPDVVKIIASYDQGSINEIIKTIQEGNVNSQTFKIITQTITILNLNTYTEKIENITQIFEHFKNIKEFCVRRNTADSLKDKDLSSLANLQFLQSLSVENCTNITAQVFTNLKNFTNITSLDLRFCDSITNMGFDKLAILLAQFPALKSLRLSYCTDEGLFELSKNLKILHSIDLGECDHVTDSGLVHLGTLKSLRVIRLCGCELITENGLIQLAENLKNLQSLNLPNCQIITDNCLIQLAKNLKALQFLDLAYPLFDDRVTNVGLTHLVENLKSLQSINLSDWRSITDKGIAKLKNHQALQYLNLTNCRGITDEGLCQLQNVPTLRSLDLTDCLLITGKGIAYITENLPFLHSLSLRGCYNIIGECFAYLTRFKNLQSLDLSYCAITNIQLAHLVANLTNLQCLSLISCQKITGEGIANAEKINPSLVIIHSSYAKRLNIA